jgi:hypothetical protein
VPHLKCVPCRVRFSPADEPSTGARCPICGMSLRPVHNLEEIIGFRAAATAEVTRLRDEDRGDLAETVALALPDPDGGRR